MLTRGGAVVKLAVPLQQLSAYSIMLDQLPVNYSPTLVLIDRTGQAQELAGFVDGFELDSVAVAPRPMTDAIPTTTHRCSGERGEDRRRRRGLVTREAKFDRV